jgi:isopenicillin-N epimerase
MTFGRRMLAHWTLDPDVTYLNHGTVGAVPRRVQAYQQKLREEMERQPSRFVLREVASMVGVPRAEPGRLRQAARAVAELVHAAGDDLVFVDNATSGATAVLHSLALAPDDEILVTDLGYGGITRVALWVARERRAQIKTVAVPYPAFDPGRLVDEITRAIGPRTRIVAVDHVSAESALIFPVAEIAARCRAKGVLVLVDGAHAPGTLDLDVPALGVDFYMANLHKWGHAPRSCGFLWAAPPHQAMLHPPVVSWNLDKGFPAEFDWVGTRDHTPFLSAPEGLAFLRELDFAAVRAYGHSLAWEAAQALGERWGSPFLPKESWFGSMVTVALPDRAGGAPAEAARLRDALLFEDKIEVQVHAGHGRLWVRVCAQVYNDMSDVSRLADAVARRLALVSA